jgi:hypothetical protein
VIRLYLVGVHGRHILCAGARVLEGSCGGNICAGALRFSSSVYTHFWLFFAHSHRRTFFATPNMVPSLSMCRPFGSPGKQSKVAFVMSSVFFRGILIESPTRAHVGSSLHFNPMRRKLDLVRHRTGRNQYGTG